MDQIEKRELPGNDASWYQAMVADRADQPTQEAQNGAAGTGLAVVLEAVTTSPPEIEDDEPDETIDAADTDGADILAADVGATDELEVAADATAEEDSLTIDETATATADEVPAEESDTDELAMVAAVPPVVEEDSPLENTSEMVGQLWTARDSFGPLEDWEPDAMDSKISSSRSFRWPTLIGIVAVVGLIIFGLVLLPSITQSRADAHLSTITTALRDLRAELPDTQTSLSVATDPNSDTSDLSSLSTQLTELAAKASALDEATQADLPKAPPLTSSAPIDEIEPIRQRAEPLGTVALTIQRRISNVVEYRTLMSGFLVLPDLPTTADAATQAELRVELASAQADSAAILADLPSDVSLEEHKALARDINERFATWQVDYLEALRTGDAATAEILILELESALNELDEALVAPLAQIRRQTDADLIDLARDIDEVVALADASES